MRSCGALAVLLLGLLSVAQAQEPFVDRTGPEQFSGPEAGALSITVNTVARRVPYQAGDGAEALFQGDIILGPLSVLQAQPPGVGLQDLDSDILFGLALRNRDTRWPGAHVRYRIGGDLERPERVMSAIAAWEAATDVTFEEIAGTDDNYVEFITGSGCSSPLGMVGGRQVIRLAPACDVGNAIHEIGHALGLHHEQARSDRGSSTRGVAIYTANIEPGREGNFLQDPTNLEDVGTYCYDSIMHYGAYAFSTEPGVLKTIETVPVPDVPIGQRSGLAPCDIETIATIYELADEPVASVFEGELELYPAGCEANRLCYLRNDLRFTSPSGLVWQASKWIEGSPPETKSGTTDGASIPWWAEPIIGNPYSDEYLRAAVLHDHYCYDENHVRGWRQTHRMFHDALLAMNVPGVKAGIMYAAVYVGGPKWMDLVPGENCGPNCVFDAIGDNASLVAGPDGVTLVRPATYDTEAFRSDFETIAAQIEANPDISLSDIEALAQAQKPGDIFYANPDRYLVEGASDPIFSAQ